MTSAWNSLQQFGTNKGNSASTTTGADTTESSQDSMARSKMWNAVVANAKANNISNEESFQQLMDDSAKSTQGVDLYGSGKWSSGDQLFGKLGKWGTGLSAEAGVKGSAGWTHSSGNTDNVGTSGRESNDSRHDTSSQAAKDFKEASDYFTSRKPPHRATLPIIMPARVLTSLPRHSPVPKTAMTSIQAAGHAAMSTVRWRHAQRA